MEPWKKEIDAVATRKIGSSRVLLKRDCRYEECNMGNFITDAMVDAVCMDSFENFALLIRIVESIKLQVATF